MVRTARSSWREARSDSRPGWGPRLVLAAIRTYQRDISPRRGPCCRYSPTCSNYASRAIEVHGLRRGARMTVGRLLRCRPGARGGADPVPAA
ncbi:membrane protein insertion efficiency factor YidD [Pedococcus sp. 2YAF34]|uniref:membrane protein insertion efficiency factor YidD n=1 Tax=Pedococcus sp. 2YAF34 TaxID=3233032 RepID=UPI003F9A9D5B